MAVDLNTGPVHVAERRHQLNFQVLRVAFEIVTDCPRLAHQLRYLAQSARQPEAPRTVVRYEVNRLGDGYEISRDGEFADTQFDTTNVLRCLYTAVYRDSTAAWPQGVFAHALTAEHRGRRVIVVGEEQVDRSRLGLVLMARFGIGVQGDDTIILHDGVVTAYPRPLRVYGVDLPLPGGVPPREALPFYGTSTATGWWVLDPAGPGVHWQIGSGAVDVVIVLETNFGGDTRITSLSRSAAARALLSQCEPAPGSAAGPLATLRAVSALTDRATCRKLRLGSFDDLDGDALQELISPVDVQASRYFAYERD